MKSYSHDGTLEGFVTCLHAAWQAREEDCEIPATGKAGDDFFATPLELATDRTRARSFLDHLESSDGSDLIRRIVHLYYSESPRAGALALGYLALWQQHGRATDQHLTHPVVREVVPLTQKVGKEIHRLKGLLRFTEGEPPYLQAIMEPDYNILLPVALHFRRRLNAQPWIILDARRHRAAAWDTRHLTFSTVSAAPAAPTPDPIAHLWKTFYRTVAIPDRNNTVLRRQNMPERYWKYLTEL